MIDEMWSDIQFFFLLKKLMCLSACLENPPFRSQFGRAALEAKIIMPVELNLSGEARDLQFFSQSNIQACSGLFEPAGTSNSPLINTHRHAYARFSFQAWPCMNAHCTIPDLAVTFACSRALVCAHTHTHTHAQTLTLTSCLLSFATLKQVEPIKLTLLCLSSLSYSRPNRSNHLALTLCMPGCKPGFHPLH